MRNSGRWGSVLTAMVTPMHDDGSVNYDGVAALARYLEANGNDGLVVTGTTGESPVLTDEERVNVWRAAAEAVSIPIIAGSGTNDTAHSVEMTKAAKDVGAAGGARGHAVLQPALAGGPIRPLHGDRRMH